MVKKIRKNHSPIKDIVMLALFVNVLGFLEDGKPHRDSEICKLFTFLDCEVDDVLTQLEILGFVERKVEISEFNIDTVKRRNN